MAGGRIAWGARMCSAVAVDEACPARCGWMPGPRRAVVHRRLVVEGIAGPAIH